MDLMDELKTRARLLHEAARNREPEAHARLRSLPELRDVTEAELADDTKRRQCLSVIARELGFQGWSHLVAALEGRADDFGTLLYPPSCGAAHWNIWSASYDEAREIRAEHGGYLLAYKKQFFIADRYFVETLGLDPEDPDWDRMGRDWVRPLDERARVRLYEKLIARRSRATAG